MYNSSNEVIIIADILNSICNIVINAETKIALSNLKHNVNENKVKINFKYVQKNFSLFIFR